MPNIQKTQMVEEIKDRFSGSAGVIMADYRGLTVKEMQELRSKLREAGGDVKVYKNSLTEIALRELELPEMPEMLQGPTAFFFATADPVAPAKAIMDFAKEHTALEVKGGLIERALVDAAAVKRVAALPSREQLIAQFMGAITGPVRGFMSMCNAPAGALARAMRAVGDQKAAA